jgi:hypothetical protein
LLFRGRQPLPVRDGAKAIASGDHPERSGRKQGINGERIAAGLE